MLRLFRGLSSHLRGMSTSGAAPQLDVSEAVLIRFSRDEDQAALERLAALDSRRLGDGAFLLADVDVLDVTVVNVALPSIQADLGFAFAGIALVLCVLSTIATSQIGGEALEAPSAAGAERLTAGFVDAFRGAAGIALAAALLGLVALRSSDFTPGARPAFAGH